MARGSQASQNPRSDPANEETERILREMEKRIHNEYAQAERELQAKLDDYMSRYKIKDQQWREEVRKGNKTKEEYQRWRTGQLAVGQRWENMRQQIAEDMHNTNMIARSITEGYMPEVYALNFNYGTYEVENGARVNTNFTMYDAQTVERLMRDDPELLPPPGRRTSERIAAGLDERWNRQQIQSVMMQGILQGESIPQIAHRLATTVGDRNEAAAIRNARTMTTGAQNAGRVDSYRRAEDMGVDMMQQWIATHDGRTRHSHRLMDGETQRVGDAFSNGCEYPGDPGGDPSEIYNCRCTLRGIVSGLQPMARQYMDTSGFGGQTYEEWKQGHAKTRTEKSNNNTESKNKQRTNPAQNINASNRRQQTGSQMYGLSANDDNNINNNGIVPEHNPPIFVTTVDFNDDNAVKLVIEDFENRARSRSIETACVITISGRVYECFGVSDGVFPDTDLGNELYGAIISHNHPIEETSYTFSDRDINLFMDYDLKTLRGVDEKYTYILSRDSNELDELSYDWYNPEETRHSIVIAFAEELGIGYRRFRA